MVKSEVKDKPKPKCILRKKDKYVSKCDHKWDDERCIKCGMKDWMTG